MGAGAEVLEQVVYYHSSFLWGFCGIFIGLIGILGIYFFCKHNVTAFLIIGTVLLIVGIVVGTFAFDKDRNCFEKHPYSEYTIMLTGDTDIRYLLRNYIFKEEIYPNIWRITERK